jgi:nucleoside-diphosphate-sugar epimerase
VVVYGAGAVRGRGFDDFRRANVDGIVTLLRAIENGPAPPPRLVLLSSLAASRPELSQYARSKRCGEQALQAADLCWTILRPPAVYGPGDTELAPLLALVRRGWALRPGPPQQRLALLHVDDLVRAVAACIDHPEATRRQTYAIDDGTPQGYDWPAIARAVTTRPVRELGVPGWLLRALARVNLAAAGLAGRAPMLTPGKVRELQQARWLCDNHAFAHATGWRPQVDLAAGAAALFR